ncbi:MAG: NAD-dependent epimerase/dehydratase family protein [Bacteroidota bacterium]
MKNQNGGQLTAVVTGANGFVGSHLTELLLEEGMRVKAILRATSNTRWLDEEKVEIIRCGLTNAEDLEKAFEGVDYIFHIAGVVASKKKEGFYQGNVETTRNVLDAALQTEGIKKVVVTSSLAAAGPTVPGKPLDELHEGKLVSTYGESKKAQEDLTQTYMDKLPITIVRPPAVFGERDTEVFLFFQTLNKGLFTQIGLRPKTLSLVHVKDLVKGIYQAGISEVAIGEIYFLGSIQPEYSWDVVGGLSSKILGKKPISLKLPHAIIYVAAAFSQAFSIFQKKPPTLNLEKANEIVQPSWSCTSEKAIEQLGYSEGANLEERLRQTLDWYKAEGWL